MTKKQQQKKFSTFSSSYIQKLNTACAAIDCYHECENIGWCEHVFETVNNGTKEARHKQATSLHGA